MIRLIVGRKLKAKRNSRIGQDGPTTITKITKSRFGRWNLYHIRTSPWNNTARLTLRELKQFFQLGKV